MATPRSCMAGGQHYKMKPTSQHGKLEADWSRPPHHHAANISKPPPLPVLKGMITKKRGVERAFAVAHPKLDVELCMQEVRTSSAWCEAATSRLATGETKRRPAGQVLLWVCEFSAASRITLPQTPEFLPRNLIYLVQ